MPLSRAWGGGRTRSTWNQLRPVVRRVVEQYLEWGRLHGGFARLRCPSCHGEHLLAFSCQTRNFCPSCQAERAALLAEHLAENVLADVPHRYVVFTIPKVLRLLFERERRLLSVLAQSAHHWKVENRATARWMASFYETWIVDGTSKPEALRAASMAVESWIHGAG